MMKTGRTQMQNKIKFIFVLFISFTLLGCVNQTTSEITTSNTSTTTTVTTTQLNLTGNQLILYNRIREMYQANEELGIFQMNNSLDSTIHYNSIGVDYVYYRYAGSDLYDVNNLYYYGEYSDNHSFEEWKMIEKLGNNFLIHNNDNDHLFFTETAATYDNYVEESFNPYEYYDVFFSEVDYELDGENHFSIAFPLSYLFEDPKYQEFFHGLTIDKNDSYESAMIHLTYDFLENNSGLHFEYWIDVILQGTYANGLTVSFESDLSFPSSLTPFTYNVDDYYLSSYESISDDMPIYTAGEPAKIYMYASSDNYVKYQLEPGYYSFNCVQNMSLTQDSTLLNEDGGIIEATPYYKITEAGTYYFNGAVRETSNNTVASFMFPEEEIGTILDPIIADGTISGHIQSDVSDYHLLQINSPGEVLKFTGVNISSDQGVYIIWNHSITRIKTDGEQYFIVEQGQDFIVTVSGTYASDYEIAFEFVPFDDLETDYNLMKEFNVYLDDAQPLEFVTPIAAFGPGHSIQRIKFSISEEADYIFMIDFMEMTGLEEHDNMLVAIPIYSETGALIVPDCISLVTHLVPGNYYVELSWYDNEYALISGFIQKIPE